MHARSVVCIARSPVPLFPTSHPKHVLCGWKSSLYDLAILSFYESPYTSICLTVTRHWSSFHLMFTSQSSRELLALVVCLKIPRKKYEQTRHQEKVEGAMNFVRWPLRKRSGCLCHSLRELRLSMEQTSWEIPR